MTIGNWPETKQGSFMADQTPILAVYSANLIIQVGSDLCMHCTVFAKGQSSQMHAIIPIIHCTCNISWHRKNLGIYGLRVAQAPRLVMKSEFTITRMCIYM